MLQSKAGTWIAGICAVVVLVSVGYGMGRRAGSDLASQSQVLAPAGAPLPAIQIEPIQPQEELAAINTTTPVTSSAVSSSTDTASLALSAATSMPEATSSGRLEGSARVREIQVALKAAGFDPGPSDGTMGQRTRTAIRDFQTAQGLEPDGKVGPKTWNKLEPFLSNTTTTTSHGTSND